MAIDFRAATDQLFAKIGAEELAGALSCHLQAVKQARMAEDAGGHRPPPPGWEAAIARLARKRAEQLLKLAGRLENKQA